MVTVNRIHHNMDKTIANSPAFPITLRCLRIDGPWDECFEIQLQKVPNIVELKKSIKDQLNDDCKAHMLKLYLAGILDDAQALDGVYSCIRNGGETYPLLITRKQILDLLNNASKHYLHIVVRPPGVLLSSISSPTLA